MPSVFEIDRRLEQIHKRDDKRVVIRDPGPKIGALSCADAQKIPHYGELGRKGRANLIEAGRAFLLTNIRIRLQGKKFSGRLQRGLARCEKFFSSVPWPDNRGHN